MLLEDFLRQRRGRGRPWPHAGNKKAPLGAFWVARQMMPALSTMVAVMQSHCTSKSLI